MDGWRAGLYVLSDRVKLFILSLSLSLLQPLWARNVPKFGIAHAMALGLGPWLAVEIPDLIQRGVVVHVENQEGGGGEKVATNWCGIRACGWPTTTATNDDDDDNNTKNNNNNNTLLAYSYTDLI